MLHNLDKFSHFLVLTLKNWCLLLSSLTSMISHSFTRFLGTITDR